MAPRGGKGTQIVTRDAALICAAGGTRAAAISLVGVLIVIHLASRGLSVGAIGLIIGTGIAASAAGTIIAALRADRWGPRRTLVVLSLLSGAGYAALAFTAAVPVLMLIAAVAMLNGLGRDRGPASALEQALLPATTTDERRTWTMAWYNVVVDSGHALGALGAALPTVFAGALDMSAVDGRALTFVLCGIAVCASTIPYLLLRPHVAPVPAPGFMTNDAVDPRTRAVVRRIAGLFAIDSIGGGFLSSALVAYWFFERYGTTEVQLAYLFFAARILNVVSHLAAAWMARRIGLVNTMVLTHLPSSVFMMLAPTAPTAGAAAALFLAREALVEMDVPTRQSYVMAVVPPSARTYASGMTNVTRNAGWAVGPLVGGTVMQHVSLAAPIVIGATLKIFYDIALYRSFRHLKAPEEVT
ncbi:MAG TPA: MFS transporter [Vicinamibacterales bacterium]|nr:MFS transporter [Vicinamibacterales bacterium]